VDGQVVRYAHVDVSGSKETTQTVSFSDVAPGEHEVKAGFPDLAATLGSVKITVATSSLQFVPDPVKALASSESPGGEVAHLFDGNLSPDSIGKADHIGGIYLAAPEDKAPVVWTDYGKPITATGLVFGQPVSTPPAVKDVTTIKLWFLPTDSGGGATIPKTNPDQTIFVKARTDAALQLYRFPHPSTGQYVIMQ
jgi:hypothetical protein